MVRLVMNTNYLEVGPEDTFLQFAPLAFDASTFELWGSLLHGAKLVIIPKTIALSPRDFATFLQHYGITTMFLTTALFNQMAREAPRKFLKGILADDENVNVAIMKTYGTSGGGLLIHEFINANDPTNNKHKTTSLYKTIVLYLCSFIFKNNKT